MPTMAMNLETREALSTLIFAITKTGDLYLDPDQVKQVKSICKKSDVNVRTAYDLLMIQLKRKHAQIRYSSTQLIAELFQRSHVFRELLVADYPVFLQLTVGIHQHPLPLPVVFADKTKKLAISLTNEWHAKYGPVYKQIVLGYEFLRYHLKVDFSNLVPVTDEARSAEQRAQEELSRRIRQRKYEKAVVEIEEMSEDIQDNVRKMGSCFDILVPKLDDESALNAIFGAPTGSNIDKEQDTQGDDDVNDDSRMEPDDSDTAEQEVAWRQYDPMGVHDNALGTNRYKLTINVNRDNPVDVQESEDNAEVFTTLRECYRLIVKKHWPKVTEWMDVLMKADHEPGEQRAEYDRLLKKAIDLKKSVTDAKSKSEDLGVNMETMYGPYEHNSDEDDEELEEVEVMATSSIKNNTRIKGKQPVSKQQRPETKNPKNSVFSMHGQDILEDDPTYAGGTHVTPVQAVSRPDTRRARDLRSTTAPEGEETREELLARAPLVPWDDDLAVWDKKDMAFNTSGLEYSHRFLGVGDGSNLVSQGTLDRMKMRTRIYNPELPNEIKACRFPMSNGRLCMRRDLVRCPYHGPVVPRDELGQIQLPPGEGGFVRPGEEELDDEQEAALIARAIAAAAAPSSSSSLSASSRRLDSGKSKSKDTSTWEDIEDDVHLALGLEKIEVPRRRGQGVKKKKPVKPPSALVNLSKPVDSSRARLLRRVATKASKDSVTQDEAIEKSSSSRDARLNRWQ
ncbi:hypothetical protein EC957_000371 [Mortierella hygrophila]|uniref:UV-stimulated scaffold protein A C-terminal domain-containing protein n=1 Tax=Mortierella hygrophila TaxID=979708 RepID=A0A9P6F7P5_9FUNG|nr:hypothetical protein EC957_000371 [Mortierella hygrophila]